MRWMLLYCCVCLAASCTHVVFDVPQPADATTLQVFPVEIRGMYSPSSESTDTLIIGLSEVKFIEYSEHAIPVTAVDTMLNITLKDGLLYDADLMRAGGVPYSIKDSMILYHYHDSYTIGISDTLILKQSGNYLVVSSNLADDDLDYWDVVLVEKLSTGNLLMSTAGNLSPPQDKDSARKKKDTVVYYGKIAPYEQLSERTFLFKPTPKQFLKLVKKNLFSEREEYKRL